MGKEFKGTSEKIRGYRNLLQSFNEEENIWLMIAELCEYTEEKMMANRDLFVESILVRKQISFSLTDLLQKYNDLRYENERLKTRDVSLEILELVNSVTFRNLGFIYQQHQIIKEVLENTNNKN